jgi:DNA-binding transcriptional ArsR family regulator
MVDNQNQNSDNAGGNATPKRRINPLLLLGEPEPNKEVRATGATGVRRPAQQELVESGDFGVKKLPSLPPAVLPVSSEPIVEPVVSEPVSGEGSVVSSDVSKVSVPPVIQPPAVIVPPVISAPVVGVPSVSSEPVSSEPVSVVSPVHGDGSKVNAVRGINPLLLPGGGNPTGGRRKSLPPLPVVKSEPVEDAGVEEKTSVVVSPIGDSLIESEAIGDAIVDDSVEVDYEPKLAKDSGENVFSDIKSEPSVVEDAVVGEETTGVSSEPVKPVRRINPLFLAGEERELADIDPHLHGQRRLRANNVILLPDDVAKPDLPKPDTSVIFNPRRNQSKEKSQYLRKLDSHIESEDWTEDNYDTDTSFGLGGEKEDESASRKTQYNKGFHLTSRDIIIIRFLARYRYAYAEQLARLVDTTPRNMSARLRVLEKRGILRKENITDRQYLWTSRKGGNVLADINFPEIRKGQISYVTLPHTLALCNLGVEFEREAGGKDLLGEGKGQDDWEPPMDRWKFGIWGNPEGKTYGYMTITEREIRQGQLRTRGNRDSKEMREMVHLVANSPEPVEFEEGQEGLFVIYGLGSQGGEHIPDLVVVKDRDPVTGKPQHIAVEMELTAKQPAEWKKILRNFRDNGEMYGKIVYFTHKRSIATAIQKADEEVGLGDKLVIRKYVPTKGSIPFWG